MAKCVVIAAGGTGGHVFPAEALASMLLPTYEVVFLGHALSGNAFFDRNTFAYKDVLSSSFQKKQPLRFFSSVIRGVIQAWRFLRALRPAVVVGFGSFHSFPVLVAAKVLRIPIVLFEPNAYPGRVNRWFSRWAEITAVQFGQATAFLQGQCQEVLPPLRQGKSSVQKEDPWDYFGLQKQKKTFLIFGGSQGALALCQKVLDALALMQEEHYQVIHLVGTKVDRAEIQAQYEAMRMQACVKAFETRMDLAWQIADVAVCRSGAATLAELLAWEVPAILIPYPYAVDDHQRHNAQFWVQTVGGGAMIEEKDFTTERLSCLWKEMAEGGAERYQEAIRLYKKRHSPQTLFSLVCSLLEKGNLNGKLSSYTIATEKK